MKYKRTIAAALAFLLTVTGATGSACLRNHPDSVAQAAEETIIGDCDDDGKVNIADMVLMQQFLVNRIQSISAGADINRDGKLNAFDAALLKRMLVGTYTPSVGVTNLLINEVCTQNDTVLTDADGDYSDWIELYNEGKSDLDLSGYGLSDTPDMPGKLTFPAGTTIRAGGYLLVYASDKGTVIGGQIHASFKLSKDGETVVLTAPNGSVIDQVEVPALKADTTYGRYKNGSDSFTQLTATPGSSNDSATERRELAAPEFSQKSGFYNSNLTVSITAQAGQTIYYTTDGSDPTTSSTAYKAGISVNQRTNDANVYATTPDQSVYSDFIPTVNIAKATILRAVAVDADGFFSPITTASYFVGINSSTTYPGCAVISLVSDPNGLFGYDNGILVKGKTYDDNKSNPQNPWGGGGWGGGNWGMDDGSTPANYNQRGDEWERAAHIDFFENDGTLGFSQDIGLRTMGGWSRAQLQKNFRCYARGEYGTSNFKYELIPGLSTKLDPDQTLNKFKTFVLRAGGNDVENTKLRDVYIQQLVEDRALDTQGSRLTVVFLDGEYWGVYNLQQDYSDKYIEANYDIDKDQVVMIKVGALEEGEESDSSLYQELLSFAQNNDLSVDANYQKMCEMIDVQNFIDYHCTEIYINNTDWPNNNYRLWRTREVLNQPYADGKWRWMLYDTELSMDMYNEGKDYTQNSLAYAMGQGGGMFGGMMMPNDQSTILLKNLMKNKTFQQQFVNTMMDIRNVNFAPDSACAKLETLAAQYRPLMNEQFQRFGPATVLQEYSTPTEFFNNQIDGMEYFLKNRYTYVPTMLQSTLSLQQTVAVTVNTNNASYGDITVNTTTIDLSKGSWKGDYFTDCPITLTAQPKDGHRFTGWSGGVTSSEETITVPLSTAVTLTANFS